MARMLRYLSMWGWGYKRKEASLAFLVVDMDSVAEYNGALSHYEAYKCNEFETEDAARKHIEEDIALSHRRFIRIYKRIEL